jgi:hypothetical protein
MHDAIAYGVFDFDPGISERFGYLAGGKKA